MELPADLDDLLGPRDVVVVSGPDAERYLHSQVTQHVLAMGTGDRRWTFVLDPTGKIITLARVTRVSDDRYELDTDAGAGTELLERLNRFKIRVDAQLTLEPADRQPVDAEMERRRIELGWPRHGAEIVSGETLVAGTGLAPIAVSFTKGCYPGQELVERMESRAAESPRSLCRVTVASGTRPGDPLLVDGAEVGQVTSVSGTSALAWVRRGHDVGEAVSFVLV
jgi:folate-binding protein YgfZ